MSSEPGPEEHIPQLQLELAGGEPPRIGRTAVGTGDFGDEAPVPKHALNVPRWFHLIKPLCRRYFRKLIGQIPDDERVRLFETANLTPGSIMTITARWRFGKASIVDPGLLLRREEPEFNREEDEALYRLWLYWNR